MFQVLDSFGGNVLDWLNRRTCGEDVIEGAIWVGENGGDGGTDWLIDDETKLRRFIRGLEH